jgi:flagellar motor protein MotB
MRTIFSIFSRALAIFAIGLLGATTLVFTPSASATTSINLGTAANYTLLAGSTITNGAGTRLTGSSNLRVAVSPGNLIQSEVDSLRISGATAFENGSIAAATAQADFEAARSQLNSLPSTESVLDLSSRTFTPGVYTSDAAWTVAANITLDGLGNSGSVFVFRTAAAMTTAAATRVILTNGATAENVYWVTGAAFNAGASSFFSGHILASAAATIGASAYIDGQIIASRTVPITLGAGVVVNYAGTASIYPYAITFDSSQTAGVQLAVTNTANTLTIPSATLTKSGFVFAGWNTVADGSGTGYTAGQVVPLTAQTSLYLYPTWQATSGSVPSASPTSSASATPSATQTPSSSSSSIPSDSAFEASTMRWTDEYLAAGLAGLPYVDAVQAGAFKGNSPMPATSCSYEVTNGVLPFGYTIDRASGIVLGNTHAWGLFRFDVSATCPGYSKIIKSQSLTVTPGGTTAYPLTVGTPMAPTPAMATPGVVSICSVSPTLPAGLFLEQSSCSVWGVPAVIQPLRTYVITASTASYSSTRQFQVGVASTLVRAVFFAPGSDRLSAASMSALNKVVAVTKSTQAKSLRITGFADSMPGRGDAALAKSRTNSVRNYLAARLPRVAFALSSNGSANATSAPLTTTAQSINRRVEIRVN